MSGISPQLYNQLRNTLLDCGPFSNEQEIRAIFADARISPWRYSLPHADNPMSRVEGTIGFLYTKFTTNQQNALVLMLKVLQDRTPLGDACYQKLNSLVYTLEQELAGLNTPPSTLSQLGETHIQQLLSEKRNRLHEMLIQSFNEGELRTLCFKLEVDYDDLLPGGKADKARELIAFVERRGHLADLIKECKVERPKLSWGEVFA